MLPFFLSFVYFFSQLSITLPQFFHVLSQIFYLQFEHLFFTMWIVFRMLLPLYLRLEAFSSLIFCWIFDFFSCFFEALLLLNFLLLVLLFLGYEIYTRSLIFLSIFSILLDVFKLFKLFFPSPYLYQWILLLVKFLPVLD